MTQSLWRVWLSESAREALIAGAQAAHPDETGGVLVGVRIQSGEGRGRPWITHAIEVRSRRRGRAHYELPAGARQRVVAKLRQSDSRLGYIGDWHSHPVDVAPSPTDIDSIEEASVEGDCSRPVLVVVRRRQRHYRIDARQWTGRSLRPLQVRLAGPLTEVTPARELRNRQSRRRLGIRSRA